MDQRRKEEIEREARKLRLELERYKLDFWDSPPDHPIDLIDPVKVAVQILHLKLEEPEEISLEGVEGDLGNLPFRPGSVFDRRCNTVTVARYLNAVARRFTLGHALGHAQIHTDNYFRDAPRVAGERTLRGKSVSERQGKEDDANLFAEELLMPAELLRPYFRQIFNFDSLRGRTPDSWLASWLSFGTERRVTIGELIEYGRDYLALLVAQCIPAGQPSFSLARRFGVSPIAMSYRLQQLKLV